MNYVIVVAPYEIIGLFVFLSISYLFGYLTSAYTRNKKVVSDYDNLSAPFRPPPWVFTFVWSILYGLHGFVCFYIWQKLVEYKPNGEEINMDIDRTFGNDVVYWQYIFMLFGNMIVWFLGPIWFRLFFVQKLYGYSLLVITIYLMLLISLLVVGFIMDWIVGILYIPYVIWLLTATSINAMIYKLN